MKQLFFYPLSLNNKNSLLPLTRVFIHLVVLILLSAYQFVFPFFIHPEVSILIYTFCFVFLFFDMLYLFFYKDTSFFHHFLSVVLSLLEVCFFNLLIALLGFVGVVLAMPLILLKILILKIVKGWMVTFSFIFLFWTLLPFALLWQGDLAYDSRKLIIFFVVGTICISLAGIYFLSKMLFVKERELHYVKNQKTQNPIFFLNIELALLLARKIETSLNKFHKSFEEAKKQRTLPLLQYEKQLDQLRGFIQKNLEYFELKEQEHLEKVYLKPLLEGLLLRFKNHQARPPSLQEALDYQSSVEWLLGSKQQLEKAFSHIIENSFQALEKSKNPQFEICVYKEGQRLVLKFLDNGAGINEEDKPQVFQTFFSSKPGLRGLGLSYVSKVIEFHKGSIQIQNSIKGKTEILIHLPFFTDNKPPDLIA